MSLVLIDEWKTLLTQLADISQGVDSLSAEEVLDLINQIKTLNKSKYAPENVKDGQAQIRIALEISDLRERISKQKLVDEKLRDKVLLEFNVKTETLFQLLYSAGPEVFAEVNQAMNLAHNKLFATYTGRKRIRNYEVDALVPEYVFPMTINQSLLGGIDSEWLKINGDHIDRLIYCNLGGDCSAQSLLVRNLCLPIFGSRVEPEVCGLGVETFMRRKLLSPNQLQDIRFVVDWLEVQYGS